MTIREELEQQEHQRLQKGAAFSGPADGYECGNHRGHGNGTGIPGVSC